MDDEPEQVTNIQAETVIEPTTQQVDPPIAPVDEAPIEAKIDEIPIEPTLDEDDVLDKTPVTPVHEPSMEPTEAP